MKVLCIFCDMLRNDSIFFDKLNKKNYYLEKILFDLGGTVYVNSYTGNPDTGRSLANLFTGKLSKENGCKFQFQYPKYNMLSDTNLFKLLNENQIAYKIISHRANITLGAFPRETKNIIQVNMKNSFIKEFVNIKNTFIKNKNLLIFLGIEDFHLIGNAKGFNDKTFQLGKEKIGKTLNAFFKLMDKDEFDYIFIFSDHGCKKDNEKENELSSLYPDRTKIYLQVRKKDEIELKFDKSLKSICDLYPTLLDIFNINYSREGLFGENLFKSNSERVILIEGNKKYRQPYETINIWSAINRNYIFITDKKTDILLNSINMKKLKINKEIRNKLYKKLNEFTHISETEEQLKPNINIIKKDIELKKLNFKKTPCDFLFSNGDLISFKFLVKNILKNIINLFRGKNNE